MSIFSMVDSFHDPENIERKYGDCCRYSCNQKRLSICSKLISLLPLFFGSRYHLSHIQMPISPCVASIPDLRHLMLRPNLCPLEKVSQIYIWMSFLACGVWVYALSRQTLLQQCHQYQHRLQRCPFFVFSVQHQ